MSETQRLHTRQQKHRRVACEARVVRYDGTAGEWSSLNMSAGGMFVTGTPLLVPGSEIEVGVWLPDGGGDQEIVARARVVWINDPATNDLRDHVPAGMGMELVDLSDDDRAALRALLYGDTDEEVVDAADLTEVGIEVGPYRILDLLGAGGMGEVYLAEHVSLGRRVALKRLNQQLARDPRATRRFFDEGRLVNRLRHDNILQIMDFISEGDDHYYVMELLEGDNLGEVLDHGPLPLSRALCIGAQLCDAMQAVHNAGIIHRDIKPTNILLLDRPDHPDFVKLLDFGIAKLQGPDPERRPGVAVGTPAYMAPEQCLGEEPDIRADIYALGAVLFHMLTGRLVFEADTWSQMLVKQVNERPPRPTRVTSVALPRRLERVILRCLRKNAWWRPASARDVGLELRAILADLDSTSTLPPPSSAPGLGHRIAPRATMAAGALAAVIATLVTASALTPGETPLPPPAVASMSLERTREPATAVMAPIDQAEPTPIEPAEPDKAPRQRQLSSAQVTAMLRLAASQVRGGDHQAAVKLCHTILRDRPSSARTYRTLAIAYSHLRVNRQACVAYRRYLSLAPRAPDRKRVLEIIRACP